MLTSPSSKNAASVASGNSLLAQGRRLVFSAQALSWLDQGLISATSFLCLVLVARWADPAALGIFAFGLSLVAILLAALEALVIRPYNVRLHRAEISVAERTSQAFWMTLSLGAVSAASLLIASAVNFWAGAQPYVQHVLLALALASPCLLLREFARKHAYAHLRVRSALLISAPACVLTLGMLALLRWNDALTGAHAIAALGIASAVSALIWLVRNEWLRKSDLAEGWRQSWRLGKWLLAAQAAIQAQAYATPWVTLLMAGASTAGAYAACASIVGCANPLLHGIFNLLIPQSSRALHEGGVTALRQKALRSTLQLAMVMGVFCLALALCGEWLMSLLYPPEYRNYSHILVILGLAAWAGALGVPASIALAAAERGGAVAFVVGVTALINVALIVMLLPRAGLFGAAMATLGAELVGSLARWAAFLVLVKNGSQALPLKAASR
jgi:O-antigen/teichoic acid export membrane protein